MVGVNSILKNRYVLEANLGTDNLGTTYVALDLRQKEAGVPEDHVAVKVLHEQVVKNTGLLYSLQEETSRARKIHSENVINVHDYDTDEGIRYIVMELLEGQTLASYLANRDKSLPRKEAYGIILGICRALEYAHQQDILHTNVSPDSIFYTADKVAKLFDFGVGDLLIDETTPAIYASPEKTATGVSREGDDIFSAAALSYHLLSGNHPFQGKPAAADGKAPRRLFSILPSRWRALSNALRLNPDERTDSISKFKHEMFGRTL